MRLTQSFFPFFAILGLISTAYSAPKVPAALLENSLIYCTNASAFSFNPQKADIGTNMNVVTDHIYERLLQLDPHNHQIKPMLAERYQVSDDGLMLTLFLRKDVAFHQTEWFTPSRTMNAEDVVFSLNRMRGYVEDLPALNYQIENGASYHQYQTEAYRKAAKEAHNPYFESVNFAAQIKEIEALDNHIVRIHLYQPDHTFLAHLTGQYAAILSKEYALQLNADENLAQLDTLPIGTGVYRLQDYSQHDYIRLSPHHHYWGKQAYINNMIIDVSTNGTGRMAKFLSKECDIAAFPEPAQLSALHNGYLVSNSGANLAYIAFNFQRPIGHNLALRRYIAQSINRERLAQILFYNIADATDKVLPSALFSDPNPDSYPYTQPEETTAHIKHKLSLWVVDEDRVYSLHPLKMATLLQGDLAKIGIQLQIKPVSQSFVMQQLNNGTADYDLILSGWLANNFEPVSFLAPLLSCHSKHNVTNLSNWCNADFDLLLDEAKNTQNEAIRRNLYQTAQAMLEIELPILPLINVKRLLAVNDKLENVHISPLGQVRLADIYFKTQDSQ